MGMDMDIDMDVDVGVQNKKLYELIDHIGARGGFNNWEGHELGGIAQCRIVRDACIERGIPIWRHARLLSENCRLLAVINLVGKRGGLDAAELVMRRRL